MDATSEVAMSGTTNEWREGRKRGRHELEQEQDLGLPREIWRKIAGHLDENNLFAFGLTCREFRRIQEEFSEKGSNKRSKVTCLSTYLKDPSLPISREWLKWFFRLSVKKNNGSSSQDLGKFLTALAALHGYLKEVEWLSVQCRLDWKRLDSGIVQAAACAGGHVDILEWLKDQECSWNSWSGDVAAASKGHLKVLEWSRRGKENQPMSEWIGHVAAGGGHLAILKWARDQGCPMTECTCSMAAGCGKLEILKWLKSVGCPWNKAVCFDRARQRGNLEVVEWLIQQG